MTNTMTAATTCTAKDFADVKYFMPDNFDFSKCCYNADLCKNYFIVDLSKLETEAEALTDNSFGLLLEYDDTMTERDTATKRVNICIYDADTQEVIDRCDNQIIGNKHFYDRLDFIAKHLKVQNSIVHQTVKIEPDIKVLYDELQKYDKFNFEFLNRDKNNLVTCRYELHSQKMKLNGRHSIDFVVGNGDKYSNFAILSNIGKIEKKLTHSEVTERYYFESYDFTVHFNDSDEPLEFYVSKTEHRKEVL